MLLTSEKEDKIYNALLVGMEIKDAFVYAGLTPKEIELVSEDEEHMRKYSAMTRELEFGLLSRMKDISQAQARRGCEHATTWLLEHMFPRYSGKPQNDMPDIHLHLASTDPASLDTVSVVKPASQENRTR